MAADVISNVLTPLGQTTQPVGRGARGGAVTDVQRLDASPSALPAVSRDARSDPKRDSLVQMVDDLNESARYQQRSIQFNIDKESGQTIIRVVDAVTHEVIRQIPSEEVVRLAERMQAFKGTLLQAEV